MTPLQFAKVQCSNYDRDTNGCKGIGINSNGTLYSFGRKPSCALSIKARCAYFEECVLPMGQETCTAECRARTAHHAEASRLYAFDTPGFSKKKGRKCAACRRREVEPRKRLCYVCAEARKKASDRAGGAERQKRSRQSRKTTSGTPANIGQNDGVQAAQV